MRTSSRGPTARTAATGRRHSETNASMNFGEHDPDGYEQGVIACPKCGAENTVRPKTVFRRHDPALGALFDGSLNQVACSRCGIAFRLDVPLMFHDEEDPCLIYFTPLEPQGAWQQTERDMAVLAENVAAENGAVEPLECRLTLTRRSFLEKISLQINDLDDRVIEYIKYQLYNTPDRKIDPIRDELLYDFSTHDETQLAFIIFDRESGRATAGAHLPMDVYRELVETLFADDAFSEEIDKLFPGYYVSVDRLLA